MIVGLLDTHAVLWILEKDQRVPVWLRSDAHQLGISDVCLWEIAIKRSAGKLQAVDDLPQVLDELGFPQVPVTRAQMWAVGELPLRHRDPFDRLLVAQAQGLGVPLITADPQISAYEVAVLW